MTIEQFKIECKRTCPSLGGGEKMDLAHMVLGMNTEIVELKEALNEEDFINVLEEISDIFWYGCNYLTFRNLHIPSQRKAYSTNFIGSLYDEVSKLQDLVKKHVAYNKPINEDLEYKYLTNIFELLFGLCDNYVLDVETGLERNIAKLKKRFPDKFDENLAINRDVEAERKILEG